MSEVEPNRILVAYSCLSIVLANWPTIIWPVSCGRLWLIGSRILLAHEFPTHSAAWFAVANTSKEVAHGFALALFINDKNNLLEELSFEQVPGCDSGSKELFRC